MQKMKVAVLAAALACATPAWAQSHEHGDMHAPGENPVVTAIDEDIQQVEQKLIALAEAIPEERWSWRPAEGVRSIGEVFMHVAADNYFLPALMGVAAPAETGVTGQYQTAVAYETREMDKAGTIAAMRASFAHLRAILADADHESLMASYDFFGNQMNGIRVWVLTATHLHEHLGQSIAYARSNGVVPPWSRGN